MSAKVAKWNQFLIKKGTQRGPQMVRKWTPNGSKMYLESCPKRSQNGYPQTSKTLCFPCVFAQKRGPRAPPKGPQKWPQNGAQFRPEMGPEKDQEMSPKRYPECAKTEPNVSKIHHFVAFSGQIRPDLLINSKKYSLELQKLRKPWSRHN